MKKKMRGTPSSHPTWIRNHFLCNKYSLLRKKKLCLRGWSGWLATEKQAKRHLYFGAYCFKNTGQLSGLGGGGWWVGGTLILSYISRFGPLLEVQNFQFHFFWGGGGGRKMNLFGGMKKL